MINKGIYCLTFTHNDKGIELSLALNRPILDSKSYHGAIPYLVHVHCQVLILFLWVFFSLAQVEVQRKCSALAVQYFNALQDL